MKDYALNIHRIDKDVLRCDRNHPYFTSEKNLEKLRNVIMWYVKNKSTCWPKKIRGVDSFYTATTILMFLSGVFCIMWSTAQADKSKANINLVFGILQIKPPIDL